MATVYVRVSPTKLAAYKAAAERDGARSLNRWAEAVLDRATQEATTCPTPPTAAPPTAARPEPG